MTTSHTESGNEDRRPTAEDVRKAQFTHATMLHPGYTDTEVDGFLDRVAEEVARLTAENAQLRDQVRTLQEEVDSATSRPSPSDQAVGILSTAQLTADEYVAEAEDFSRQMTSEARAQYEEQLSQARNKAGAIIQAAQEAAASVAAAGGWGATDTGSAGTEEMQEQVAYLKAFGQACRVQLRSYLEALLTDVETEWGHAHPGALPPVPLGVRPQQLERNAGGGTPMTFTANTANADGQEHDGSPAATVPATRSPS
jgi:DivIVA domain-containing protein